MIHLLFAALLPAITLGSDPHERFRTLHEKGDREGCAALWRADPSLALPTIEKDLDAALALREGAKESDAAAVRALEERALWGAGIAREALDAPLIADVASARAAWSQSDRRLYREARAVHARAVSWIEKGEHRFGQEAGLEATTRSLALGDWRGAAMGHEATAVAQQGTSSFDDALVSWSQARMIYRELALRDEELACLRNVIDMCYATERHTRGREAADQAVSLARAREDRKRQAEFLERRAGFEEKLGLGEKAQATRREAKSLGD